jgi:DNA polymerase III subunit alpha, Gram-positive type
MFHLKKVERILIFLKSFQKSTTKIFIKDLFKSQLMLKEYAVVDIETTGLSKHFHQITELAAVKVKDNKVIDEFQTLINPKVPIPRFITRLTGIDNELVKDAPPIKKALPHFLNFLEDHTVIAHNATFDHGFLHQNALRHLKQEFNNQKLCTRKLANRLLPDLQSKKLSVICDHFNIINNQEHRAMSDVQVTNQVFQNFLDIMKKKKITTPEQIFHFEKSKISYTN